MKKNFQKKKIGVLTEDNINTWYLRQNNNNDCHPVLWNCMQISTYPQVQGNFNYADFALNKNGDILVVGTPLDIIRVWQGSYSNWSQVNSDIALESDFTTWENDGNADCRSVDIDDAGDTIIVGCPAARYSNVAHPDNQQYGYVAVYENINNSWTRLGDTFRGEFRGNYVGGRVAISGDGKHIAFLSRSASFQNSGDLGNVLKVYKYESNSWVQVGSTIQTDFENDTDLNNHFSSVFISDDGNILVAGKAGFDSASNENIGKVEIFKKINNDWQEVAVIYGENADDSIGKNATDYSTVSVSSDGTVIAVSGGRSTEHTADARGYVKVYKLE